MNDIESGIERVWARIYNDAAYAAALMVWLIEHKSDAEADQEIAEILRDRPWTMGTIIGVMEAWS